MVDNIYYATQTAHLTNHELKNVHTYSTQHSQHDNDLHILSFNAQSWVNKATEIAHIISRHNAKIVLMQETWGTARHPVQLANYTAHNFTRPTTGGGVSNLIHHSIASSRLFICPDISQRLSQHNIECIATIVQIQSKRTALLNIYIPHPRDIPISLFKPLLNDLFSFVINASDAQIIAGDFNLHHKDWGSRTHIADNDSTGNYATHLADLLFEHSLEIANDGTATFHSQSTDTETAIDIVATSHHFIANGFPKWQHTDDCLSDHKVLKTSLQWDSDELPPIQRTQSIKDGRLADDQFLRQRWVKEITTAVQEWSHNTPINTSIDDQWSSLHKRIVDTATSVCGITKKSKLPRTHKSPFWSPELSRLKENKKLAFCRYQQDKRAKVCTQASKQAMKEANNAFRSAIREHNTNQWGKIIDNVAVSGKGKGFYSAVKNVMGVATSSISKVLNTVTDEVERDPVRVANIFNDHFLDTPVLPDTDHSVDYLHTHSDDFISSSSSHIEDDFNAPFTMSDLQAQLTFLAKHALDVSNGEDGISVRLIVHGGIALHTALLRVINASWTAGKLAARWKLARVCPMRKTDDNSIDPTDFRPISVLNTQAKLMERMVYQRLQRYVERKKILADTQFAFREKRSSVDSLVVLKEHLNKTITANHSATLVSLDIRKGYDSVRHTAILKKLHEIGVRGNLLCWLADFLKDRHQFVALNGAVSSVRIIVHGVPQGSVLAPLLYIIVSIHVLHNGLRMYQQVVGLVFADDVQLLIEHKKQQLSHLHANLSILNSAIIECAKEIAKFGSQFNPQKCKLIHFYPSKARNWPKLLAKADGTVCLDGTELQTVKMIKVLGVWFDSCLRFSHHYIYMARKARKVCNLLQRLCMQRYGLSGDQAVMIYKVLIRTHLEYAAPVWHNPQSTRTITPLSQVQRYGLMIATRAYTGTALEALEVDTGVQPLHLRLDYLVMRYHAMSVRRPIYLCNPATDISHPDNAAVDTRHVQRRWNRLLKESRLSHRLQFHLHTHSIITTHVRESMPPPLPDIAELPDIDCPYNPKRNNGTNTDAQAWVQSQIKQCWSQSQTKMIAFVDASQHETQLCTGIGVYIDHNDGYPELISEPHCLIGDGTTAELAAICYPLRRYLQVQTENKSSQPTNVYVFTDSKSARACITDDIELNDTMAYETIAQARDIIRQLQQLNCTVHIKWIPSHVDIQNNEIADLLAKKAVETMCKIMAAVDDTDFDQLIMNTSKITLGAICCLIRAILKRTWQKMWSDGSGPGLHLRSLVPTLLSKSRISVNWGKPGNASVLLGRLRYGNCGLNAFLKKINVIDTNECLQYPCEGYVEDVTHFLKECVAYTHERKTFYAEAGLPSSATLQEMLGLSVDYTLTEQTRIVSALRKYVVKTKRFVPTLKFNAERIVASICEGKDKFYEIKWMGSTENTYLHEDIANKEIPILVHNYENNLSLPNNDTIDIYET